MSWSVSAVGKTGPVATKLAGDFSRITYLGPEETIIKNAVAELVATTLAANTKTNVLLKVQASGSGAVHSVEGSQQSVSLSIELLYGFVE